jgi:hypothetical protein
MATKAIYIHWGIPFPGRERMALEEFSSYMQWANELKSTNKIERFEVYGPLTGTQQTLSGFTMLEGSDDQIDEIANSEDFRQRTIRVMTVCNHFGMEHCEVGVKLGERMQRYNKALAQMGL